ncbi:hypothetical protein [uncultured Sphingomonas sp.]|uniref:hypothetical protein n=1 Tax=uncultured Sphingomonas sp. TaxID=158754 RepID=UPI0035C9A20F
MARRIALGCAFVAILAPVSTTFAQPTGTAVAEQGETRLSGGSAGTPISAALTTRFATASERTPAAVTRCSGGRVHCSLVDRLMLRVGKDRVAVPRGAILALADIDRGALHRLTPDRYELVLDCGDAAAAYQARLFFDRRRVDRLEIWSSEAGKMEEATTYRDLSHAFL